MLYPLDSAVGGAKAGQNSFDPSEVNNEDLGAKKILEIECNMMHGVGICDENVCSLVGAGVVVREQARDDFKGVLRMICRSNGENLNPASTKTAK